MTKEEHITYWSESALKDWKVALLLFKEKHFMYSMFFAHLTLEKLLKLIGLRLMNPIILPKFITLITFNQNQN